MSRLGKRAITIPAGTDVSIGQAEVVVKGKGGELRRALHPAVLVSITDGAVSVAPTTNNRIARALWGTYASHIINMIEGVNTPFKKVLEVRGIGFRAELSGKTLKLAIGFSHPVLVEIPEGITVTVEKNIITVTGASKEQVGQFAANVRSLKKPEPYKGKGIRYEGEYVREKQGKKTA